MEFVAAGMIFEEYCDDFGNLPKEILETALVHINHSFFLSQIVNLEEQQH